MTPPKKILFVDDAELFLELEQSIFRRDHLELLTARNGREALAIIRKDKPDLVFLDLYMPEMDGAECCRRVKGEASLRSIPVVMVTNSGRAEDVTRCRSAGCDEIVYKPIDHHRLVAVAERFLDLSGRASPRVPARLRIHYGPEGEKLLSDYSVNLSMGGIFIETDRPLPAEAPLTLEFLLPKRSAAIRCRGRVAWINEGSRRKPQLPSGMGVQFVDLTLADLEALREFIHPDRLAPEW